MPDTLPRIDNLAPNPSFETGTTGWTGTRATLAAVTTEWWTGAQSLELTCTTVNATYLASTPTSVADAMRVRVTAGTLYSFGARAKTLLANQQGRIEIGWRDAAGALLSTIIGVWTAIEQDGLTWQRLALESQEAPVGSTFVTVSVAIGPTSGSAAVGNKAYIDGVHVSPTSDLPSYTDGAQGTYHHWVGTAHASASYREAIVARQTYARRGMTRISSKLYLADQTNTLQADITSEALDGRVGMNIHNPIKHLLALSGVNASEIVPYSSYVAPFITLEDAMGNSTTTQLGLYICTPAKQSHRQGVSMYTIEGRGLTWVLANSYPSGPYTALAGSNPVANVQAILDNHALRHAIPETSAVHPDTMTWDIDNSWLTICNDQLFAAAYYSLWDDLQGVIKSMPYFELASAEPALQLFSGEGGIVTGVIEQEGVYDSLANQIIVLKENMGGAPIRVIRTNNDPRSPSSVPNLGRTIPRVIKDSNLISVTQARARARRELELASSFTNKLKVSTLPQPDRAVHEVYDLAIYNAEGRPIGFGLWWCDGWDLGFTTRAATQVFQLKRIEAYGWDEVYT